MSDLIRKYDVVKICNEQIWNGADDYYPISANQIAKKVKELPTVDAVPVIRCKDCKHFELNHLENVNGMPLIVAHEICTKWGAGCKTSSDGYCFMAERKEHD